MGKTKKVIIDGIETTVKEYASKHKISYACAWKRIKQHNAGVPQRQNKRSVRWNNKEYPSIAALARELGYSREWIRRLINKQENKET